MIKASDINFTGNPKGTTTRTFTTTDHVYRFEIQPVGVIFELDRLRRSSHELWGELIVKVNGNFPDAHALRDGVISAGDLNLSSVQARVTRAKLLTQLCGDKEFEFIPLVEDFSIRVITAERLGNPSVGLCETDFSGDGDDPTIWEVQGFPLLSELPLVLFGDAAAAKSYMALWLAGTIALRDVPVLYLDWEYSGKEHRKRLERLFQPPPNRNLLRYLRCDAPLIRIIDGVLAEIKRWKIRYVVCDSIGFALHGSPLDAEPATQYFAATRRFNCGSLHLAHITKHQEEGKDPTIFGSNFFKAGARSAWYIERATENPEDELRVGLYQRKLNSGRQRQKPLGYRLAFEGTRTRVEPIDLESIDELAAHLPMVQRIRTALGDGPLSIKRLAEDLASTPNIVRAVIAKHKSQFMRLGDKISIKTGEIIF